MDVDELLLQCRDLERLLGWTDADGRRVASLEQRIAPHIDDLIDDFEPLLERPSAAEASSGGGAPDPLRRGLHAWLSGVCDDADDRVRVARCESLGAACCEAGLDPTVADLAFSHLCSAVRRAVVQEDPQLASPAALESLDKRLDLDRAIVAAAQRRWGERQLQRAEREATIRRLVGGVAHELRQPLNVLRTSAYYLRNAPEPEAEKAREHLERIERHVASANRVIHAMAAFAKPAVPVVSPVSIAQVLAAALEFNPLPSDIEVVIDCPEGVASVPADFDQLQIVLGNLIRNARDAMPAGGRLSLVVREEHEHCSIAVADTGKGVAAAELARITEPLYTTKARGMGLGLAIAQTIVDNHGGSLCVESEAGVGSTVTVVLPRLAAGSRR